jgi:hypothetical protein
MSKLLSFFSTFVCAAVFAAVVVGSGWMVRSFPALRILLAIAPSAVVIVVAVVWMLGDCLTRIPDSAFQIPDTQSPNKESCSQNGVYFYDQQGNASIQDKGKTHDRQDTAASRGDGGIYGERVLRAGYSGWKFPDGERRVADHYHR